MAAKYYEDEVKCICGKINVILKPGQTAVRCSACESVIILQEKLEASAKGEAYE